jgi:hypothetical protein
MARRGSLAAGWLGRLVVLSFVSSLIWGVLPHSLLIAFLTITIRAHLHDDRAQHATQLLDPLTGFCYTLPTFDRRVAAD